MCHHLGETSLAGDVARHKFRVAYMAVRASLLFSLAGDAISPEKLGSMCHHLGETSLAGDVAGHKFRVAYMAVRASLLFSLAGDAISPENHPNGLRDSSPSDTVIDIPLQQNIERLRQAGGVQGVASNLQTDTESGIHGGRARIDHRQQKFGFNRIEKLQQEVKLIVFDAIKDPIIILLLLCAVLSLVFGVIKDGSKGWSGGGGIFAVVFVVVSVTSYCKIWSRSVILARPGDDFTVDVVRNGETHPISMFDVVVGDVICLKTGNQVPADGLYIRGDSLHVEATGSPMLKGTNDPFLFSGSKVSSGSARMLITAVGMKTAQWQLVSKHYYDANQKTPLEKELHKLAMIIANIGFLAAFLVLVVLLICYFRGNMHDDRGNPEFLMGKTRIHQVFFDVIGILATPLVIASTTIPEGLLLAVKVPIAYSTYRMAAVRKALARNLSAWEEITSITEIRTNERGILTSQILEVGRFWYALELLVQGVLSDNTQVSQGSSAESIELAPRESVSQSRTEDAEGISPNCTILHQKGDPEGMLAKCSKYYDEYGNIKEITKEVREILKQKILEMKSKLPQYIGFSCSAVSEDNKNDNEKCITFTLVGDAGLTFPCPPEIKETVNDFQRAEVYTILLTGSEKPEAKDIAKELGILDPNDTIEGQVVDGLDYQNYPKDRRLGISDKIRVMARATTMARRYLVEDLKEKGHVVEGFEPTATLLRWARSVYYKILAYTEFQLMVSISSLVIDLVTAISASEPLNIKVVTTISSGKAPVAALQVLWEKLIVGVLAVLAITIEEPPSSLQELPSFKKTEQFLANILWKNIVGQALYPIIILLTITFKGESVFNMDPKVKDTMIFNIFVLWQLSIIFSTKRFEINIIKWIQRDKLFWTIVGSIFLLQVVIVEKLEEFAGTKRLNWMQWAECIGGAVLAWPVGWLVKRINISAPAS